MAGKLKGKFAPSEIKKHVLTAISYLLPLIVASGLLIAIGNLTGGVNIASIDELDAMTVPSALTTLGVMGMGLIPAFIGGYIAYSVADRPGIAPGFLMGMIASFLNSGFLGGLIGGLLVGYIALVIETYLKVPKWAQALMPMMIVPLLSSALGGLIMFFVLGTPITMLTGALTNFITGLDQSQKALYGFIIGWIGCLDYGGAISKVPNLICDGLMADGIYGPEGIKVLAAMVPPIGVTLGWLLSKAINKPIFKYSEEENIKVAFPMGICMISEGVIPIAMNDLIRTVICTSIGCGVCGAISFSAGVESMVPSGGVFVIPAMTNPLMAVVALLVGSCVTAVLLVLIKKRLTPEQVDDLGMAEDDTEEEIDLSGFSLS
ncbi:MAG TPA: PTS fructose transporter subunit IIC [Enorma massiliensis]|uniref:PTS fructose transporter subunit IIC n=1 Tax=Enorma massiliensis TaxID=1472761 RepID=UPI001E15FD59|nr:PTS fructose transporter subunit IIC [Enorma massiliensis]HJG62371.1 PTS fructose transporter subunit IIC [Enorma massiliensis]